MSFFSSDKISFANFPLLTLSHSHSSTLVHALSGPCALVAPCPQWSMCPSCCPRPQWSMCPCCPCPQWSMCRCCHQRSMCPSCCLLPSVVHMPLLPPALSGPCALLVAPALSDPYALFVAPCPQWSMCPCCPLPSFSVVHRPFLLPSLEVLSNQLCLSFPF